VKFNKHTFQVVLCAMVFVVMASSAQAINITGRGWFVTNTQAEDANFVPSGTPDVTFTTSSLDFSSYGNNSCVTTCSGNGSLDYTVNSFLNSLGAASNIVDTVTIGNSLLSNGTSTGMIFVFTGTANFQTNQAFGVAHDDGTTFNIGSYDSAGNCLTTCTTAFSDPGPTSPVFTQFNYNVAGLYTTTGNATGNQPFEFIYGECCGAPAVFISNLTGPLVPEPTSIILLGTAAAFVFGGLRRRYAAR